MSTRALLSLLAAVVVALSLAPAALADGDPASDVLLGENVFYPYSPQVSPSLQKTLNAETAAAKKAGFPLKVALIAAPVDLGVIPDLFGKPQKYADFLDQEISFQGKQPLLVVMKAGYGAQGVTAHVRADPVVDRPAGQRREQRPRQGRDRRRRQARRCRRPPDQRRPRGPRIVVRRRDQRDDDHPHHPDHRRPGDGRGARGGHAPAAAAGRAPGDLTAAARPAAGPGHAWAAAG